MRIFVHATPYMYESKNWPWIKTEVHAFLNRMSFLGDDAQFILYALPLLWIDLVDMQSSS